MKTSRRAHPDGPTAGPAWMGSSSRDCPARPLHHLRDARRPDISPGLSGFELIRMPKTRRGQGNAYTGAVGDGPLDPYAITFLWRFGQQFTGTSSDLVCFEFVDPPADLL